VAGKFRHTGVYLCAFESLWQPARHIYSHETGGCVKFSIITVVFSPLSHQGSKKPQRKITFMTATQGVSSVFWKKFIFSLPDCFKISILSYFLRID